MKLLALVAAMMVCTACSALPEEDRAFAVALGVSENGGVWETCARIPTYQTGGGYLTLRARGNSLGEALAALNAAAPMELHYGQVRLLLFARELAESAEFPGVVRLLAQRGEVRSQAAVCVTADSVPDVMDALEPATGSRLSKALEALLRARKSLGVLPKTTLADLQLAGERQQCVLLSAALEPAEGNAQTGMDAPAGMQAASGAGKIQFAGGWLLGHNGQVQGQLSAMDMQLLSLMQGKLRQGALTLPEGTVTLLDASARTELSGNEAHCKVRIVYSASSFTETGLQEVLISRMQSLTAKLAASGCDALGLGRKAMRTCMTMAQWHDLHWPERYPALTWHFTVEAKPEA